MGHSRGSFYPVFCKNFVHLHSPDLHSWGQKLNSSIYSFPHIYKQALVILCGTCKLYKHVPPSVTANSSLWYYFDFLFPHAGNCISVYPLLHSVGNTFDAQHSVILGPMVRRFFCYTTSSLLTLSLIICVPTFPADLAIFSFLCLQFSFFCRYLVFCYTFLLWFHFWKVFIQRINSIT